MTWNISVSFESVTLPMLVRRLGVTIVRIGVMLMLIDSMTRYSVADVFDSPESATEAQARTSIARMRAPIARTSQALSVAKETPIIRVAATAEVSERAQMDKDSHPTEYFLDAPPANVDLAGLPATAKNVLVATVRLLDRPTYLVGRDQSGQPSSLPTDLFAARIEIVRVLHGPQVAPGTKFDVHFGTPGFAQRLKYPHTTSERARDYAALIYLSKDGVRRLGGFPIEEQAYEEWRKGVAEFERARSRPGAIDQ
jgi:hypothetical protein